MAVTVINNRINLSDLILHPWKKGSDGKWSYRKGNSIWHLDGTTHVYDLGTDTGYTAEVFLTCDKTYRYETVIHAEGTVSAPDEALAKRCAEFYSVLKIGMTEDDPQIIKIKKDKGGKNERNQCREPDGKYVSGQKLV